MYIGAIPTPAATESRQEFTATANQTVFNTTGGTVGYCDCYLNGVKMANSDFSFDGADVTLTTGAAAGDTLAVVMRQADNALVALPIKDSAGNNVLSEANGVASLSYAAIPSGGIVQVQSTQYTGLPVMTSVAANTDYVLCNGTAGSGTEILNVSITPKFDNSKIWLQVSWCGEFEPGSSTYNGMFFLYRDSTKLKQQNTGNRHGGIMPPALSQPGTDAISTMESCFFQYFDTPAVDTTLVYKVGVRMANAGTISTNRTRDDSDTNIYERGISSIVAIEIRQ